MEGAESLRRSFRLVDVVNFSVRFAGPRFQNTVPRTIQPFASFGVVHRLEVQPCRLPARLAHGVAIAFLGVHAPPICVKMVV